MSAIASQNPQIKLKKSKVQNLLAYLYGLFKHQLMSIEN